jgi:undecaprenyl-diphosphatase
MFQHLIQFDKHLFYLVNSGLSNSFFDWLMPGLRNPYTWVPLYICMVGYCIYTYKKVGVYIILALVFSFAVADFGSATLIKPLVHRVRPCNCTTLAPAAIKRTPCGSGYSFPSSHASNHFAMAMCLCLIFGSVSRKWVWYTAMLWAFAISFAQVYVGVHYPIDVTVGALFGMVAGSLVALLFKRLQPQFRV